MFKYDVEITLLKLLDFGSYSLYVCFIILLSILNKFYTYNNKKGKQRIIRRREVKDEEELERGNSSS